MYCRAKNEIVNTGTHNVLDITEFFLHPDLYTLCLGVAAYSGLGQDSS
jgi:hypothetical protein